MPWAKLGEKSAVVAANTFTAFDMDSAAGWSFFTNAPATFENGANTGGKHGISALVSGVYEAWFNLTFIRTAAIAHDTKLAFLSANVPITSTDSDWLMNEVVANWGAFSSGIDAASQYWRLFTMQLTNIPDGIPPANIPGFTTWTISGEHDGGGNANGYPSLYVKRIAAALPGGIS